ncbi:MAG: hypothetical protein JRN37_09670 [Nitrososphaerota archaeon]|nr:hypothetical protein [Nitrososphaerota archaeon]MDG7039396.1 hypothetical protein [Nitrososphaerota archaeon]
MSVRKGLNPSGIAVYGFRRSSPAWKVVVPGPFTVTAGRSTCIVIQAPVRPSINEDAGYRMRTSV